METEGNFMEDWIKKWKQELSWQERWDVNGWGRKPKPKMVIDLDSIYKDGKLFGYDIYYDKKQINGEDIDIGPLTDVIKDGTKYTVMFAFEWQYMKLSMLCTSKDKDGVPVGARTGISLDFLFAKMVQVIPEMIVRNALEQMIREIEMTNEGNDN